MTCDRTLCLDCQGVGQKCAIVLGKHIRLASVLKGSLAPVPENAFQLYENAFQLYIAGQPELAAHAVMKQGQHVWQASIPQQGTAGWCCQSLVLSSEGSSLARKAEQQAVHIIWL